jgi:hypothetical protein
MKRTRAQERCKKTNQHWEHTRKRGKKMRVEIGSSGKVTNVTITVTWR